MNGFVKRGLAGLCLAGGLTLAVGCEHYRNLVDPCYPERYEYSSRESLKATFAAQAHNGHVLDQTVWNYHFEPGKDTLNLAGLDKVAYIARRRPAPDAVVFVQTAQDLGYDQAAPERFVEQRNTLDQQRMEVVRKYLMAQTANRPVDFQVVVHDPSEVGIGATPMNNAVQRYYLSVQGALPSSGGGNVSGGSGTGGSGR